MPGWTVYLTVGGVRQLPGKTTGADGCALWAGLAPGEIYGVEEALPAGWVALSPVSHSFGAANPGDDLQHTFINWQGYRVYLPNTHR